MFSGQLERELLDGEPWLLSQSPKLPLHLQLLVDQQEQQDIWTVPSNES